MCGAQPVLRRRRASNAARCLFSFPGLCRLAGECPTDVLANIFARCGHKWSSAISKATSSRNWSTEQQGIWLCGTCGGDPDDALLKAVKAGKHGVVEYLLTRTCDPAYADCQDSQALVIASK